MCVGVWVWLKGWKRVNGMLNGRSRRAIMLCKTNLQLVTGTLRAAPRSTHHSPNTPTVPKRRSSVAVPDTAFAGGRKMTTRLMEELYDEVQEGGMRGSLRDPDGAGAPAPLLARHSGRDDERGGPAPPSESSSLPSSRPRGGHFAAADGGASVDGGPHRGSPIAFDAAA